MRSVVVILGYLLILLSINANGQMRPDFAITDEDKEVTFNVTDNDEVFLPQPNTVDLNTSALGRQTSFTTDEGRYTVNDNGDVTFDPANDFNGTSSIQYSMRYGFFGANTGIATIHVTVNVVNDKPITNDDEDVTNEDVPITIKVLDNDVDRDDGIDPGSIDITEPTGGSFVATLAGEVKFTPDPEFSGNARAKYTVRDYAGAESNTSDIKIKVNSINDAPVAVNDAAETDEGISIVIKILSNDYDVDGSIAQSTVRIKGESGGSFAVNNNGEVRFTPSPGFTGTATATYTVKDDDGLESKVATITVTVHSLNDPPIANNDIASTAEDAGPLTIKVHTNDSDPDGTLNLASIVVTNPINGTFVANASGEVTYTPPANFHGVATAKYTIKDKEGATSNEATITVTVNAVNDPPSFDAIANQRVLKNAANKTVTITGITAGPLETETLTFKATSGSPAIVPNPVITYNGTASTATLTFKPQPNQAGTATITVELTDQGSKTFTHRFDIQVINVEIISVPVTLAQVGQLYQYVIEITDVPETLSIVATQKPGWATLTSTGKNEAKLSGTPPANAPQNSPVTLQLKDGSTVLDQQQFTITLNKPPVITSIGPLTADEDTPLALNPTDFQKAFSDPDNQDLAEVMFTKVPKNGELKLGNTELSAGAKVSIASLSNVTYNPDPNHTGQDTLYWKGSDGYVFSNEAHAHFLITAKNDLPVITYIETESLEYELGSEVSIKLTTGITVKDDDSPMLSGAEIRIDFTEYEQDKEILTFKDTLNIRGAFNPAAGILILSGTSSVANYQAALRTVKYKYVNLAAVNLRTERIYVTVSDGESSVPKWRTISLIYTFKDLDIPSAFSPNGDRANEAWLITSPNTTDGTVPYTEALIRVYNKRGLLVYEAKGFERPWDGTFAGKELPVDTYYYTIDLNYNRVRYKGVVTILR